MYSEISFESKKDLLKWLKELGENITNPTIPYSFYEIRKELLRREMCDLTEEDIFPS